MLSVRPLISDPIRYLLKGFPEENLAGNCNELNEYFESDGSYNWNQIAALFSSHNLNIDVNFSYEFGKECAIRLRPIWKCSPNYLRKLLSESSPDEIEQLTNWMRCGKLLWNFPTGSPTETSTIENILLFTSELENSLGCVYYTVTKKPPPHLFRDLLRTQELEEVFGKTSIYFLKVLLGTPNCVNIRNIAWHGFPCPDDIPSYYVAVLALSIISLSKILHRNGFREIGGKSKITHIANSFGELQILVDDSNFLNTFETWMHSDKACIVPKSHIIFWKRIYDLYRSGGYSRCVLLILPQLELLFRIIYGNLNGMDISAKRDEYYIILDTLFEEFIAEDPPRVNLIYSSIDTGLLKLIFDIFVAPWGPRLRDKVSHGEVDLNTMNREVCQILIYVALCTITSDFPLNEYESRYHPNCILYKGIETTKSNLIQVRALEIPEPLRQFINWDRNLAQMSEIPEINSKLEWGRIKIFFRPPKENEIVTYIINIVKCISEACVNLVDSFQEIFRIYEAKQLRSRRRQTLTKMLETLPEIWFCLNDACSIANRIFHSLQFNGDEYLQECGSNLQRFVKHLLKYATNLSKYCHKSRNEWERCQMYRQQFYDFLYKEKSNIFQ